jgi:uncharacterized protein VirK/YbjX
MSGSLDLLGNKIAITLKIIDVKNKTIYKSAVREFDNQELEVQRMIEILLKEMHGVTPDKILVDRLAFKNDVITSNNFFIALGVDQLLHQLTYCLILYFL